MPNVPVVLVFREGGILVVAQDASPDAFRRCFPGFPDMTDTGWRGGGAYFQGGGVHFINASSPVFDLEDGLIDAGADRLASAIHSLGEGFQLL